MSKPSFNRQVRTMIRAIIFDIGGVLVKTKPLLDQVLEVFQPENEKEFWEKINIEGVPLCKGEMSLFQFWKKIAQKVGRDIPDHVLRDLWAKDCRKYARIDEGVQEIVNSLKETYSLAILSNTIDIHAKLNEELGIYEPFDVVILSHEVGLTKNEKEMFLLVTEKLGVAPEECVFIDDIQKFIDVAQSVGMQAILFENPEQLKDDLQTLHVAC